MSHRTESGHGHGSSVSRQPLIVFTDSSPRFMRDKSIQLRYTALSLVTLSPAGLAVEPPSPRTRRKLPRLVHNLFLQPVSFSALMTVPLFSLDINMSSNNGSFIHSSWYDAKCREGELVMSLALLFVGQLMPCPFSFLTRAYRFAQLKNAWPVLLNGSK